MQAGVSVRSRWRWRKGKAGFLDRSPHRRVDDCFGCGRNNLTWNHYHLLTTSLGPSSQYQKLEAGTKLDARLLHPPQRVAMGSWVLLKVF